MKRRMLVSLLWLGSTHVGAAIAATDTALEQAAGNYQSHCQSCHGTNRFGGTGPALLPESLSRIKPDEIRNVIRNGRPASQ
ncbi:MAG: cytochrome c, partial [Pseudomonas sp.]